MPIPPDVLARVSELAKEVQGLCARANVSFVLVLVTARLLRRKEGDA